MCAADSGCMTILRTLPCLVALAATFASPALLAGEPPIAAASARPPESRTPESTKTRQDAERQRLIAKLRAEAPKTAEKPKSSVLDLPIFNRRNSP